MSGNQRALFYIKEIQHLHAAFRKILKGLPKNELGVAKKHLNSLVLNMQTILQKYGNGQTEQVLTKEISNGQKSVLETSARPVAMQADSVAVVDPQKEITQAHASLDKHLDVPLAQSIDNLIKKAVPIEKQTLVAKVKEHVAPAVVDSGGSVKDRLATFLVPQKVKVISIHEESKHDVILDDVATKLGQDFNAMRQTLKLLRAAYSDKGVGSMLLDKFSSDKKSQEIVMSFFNYAKRNLLIEYGFVGKRRYLSFKIDVENALFRKFLTGNWFERYIYITVLRKCSYLSKNSIIARNVVLEFPSGDKAEIDMVIIHRDQLYLLEMKTRDYKEAVKKYKNRAPLLGIPLENIFFVMMERQGDDHKHMEAFHLMRFLIADELVTELNKQFTPKSTSEFIPI